MAYGYIQAFLQFPEAKNGEFWVYLANSVTKAIIYDPVNGNPISQPLSIDSDGVVPQFWAETDVFYDLDVRDYLGAQVDTRNNVSVLGGSSGVPGPQGPQGVQGPAGATGATGATGAAGTNGTNGTDGEDGEDGVSLVSIRVDETTDTGKVLYNLSSDPNNWIDAGDIVPAGLGQVKVTGTDSLGFVEEKVVAGTDISIDNSGTQLTINNTAPETFKTQASQYSTVKDFLNTIIEGTSGITVSVSADFNKIILSGAGIGGSGFTPKGAWVSGTTYNEGDGVWYYDDSVSPVINRYYVATATTSTNPYTEGTGWVIMFSIDQLGDQMVKLDNSDSTTGFLLNKIIAGQGITFTRTVDAGGDYITIDGQPTFSVGVNGTDKTISDLSNVVDLVDGELTEVVWDGNNIKVNHDTYAESGTSATQTATGLPKFDDYGHYKGESQAIAISDVTNLESSLNNAGDGKVATQAGDLKGYLEDKLIVAGSIVKATVGSPTDKMVQLVGTGKIAVSDTDAVGYAKDKIISGSNISITLVDEGTTDEKMQINADLPESVGLYAGKMRRYQKQLSFTNTTAPYNKLYVVGNVGDDWAFSGSEIEDMCNGDFLANYANNGVFTLSKEAVYEVVFSAHAYIVSGSTYPVYFNLSIMSSYDDFATQSIENAMQMTLEDVMLYQENMDNFTLSALINNTPDGQGRLKKFKVYVNANAFSGSHYMNCTFRNSYISVCEQVQQIPGPQGDKGDPGSTTLDGLTDVDVSGATDGQVLTYDADTSTWVPGTGGGGGSDTYTVKVNSGDTTPGFLADKITTAEGSPITVSVVGDTLVLDAIEENTSDPLLMTTSLMTENGTMAFTGSCWSSTEADGAWETGYSQNTSDAYYRVRTMGRGTVSKVSVYCAQYGGDDLFYGSGSFGAIRIGLFDLAGNCKGMTPWTRGLTTTGSLSFDLTPCPGQNLTIERNAEYWIGIVARGMVLIAYNKASSGFNLTNLRYAVKIRSASQNASWSAFTTSGTGYVENGVAIAMMSATAP